MYTELSTNGRTYTVNYSDEDTRLFTAATGAPHGIVRGHGAFVFDSESGDLLKQKGSARGNDDIEWLAFSQDAQDFGRATLSQRGVAVNPCDLCGCEEAFPELKRATANPKTREDFPTGMRVRYSGKGGGSAFEGTVLGPYLAGDWDEVVVERADGQTLAVQIGHLTPVGSLGNPADVRRISRTRGVKTERGPYSARRGYQPWIRRRGKLGRGFLTTMTKAERRASLDQCVSEYGYRSCLGSIMVLERAKTGPRGEGVGVGVKYATKLKDSRDYLRKTYGGPGSFGPRKVERPLRVANPGDVVEIAVAPKRREDTRLYLFVGGRPTDQQILDAPMFTVFPATRSVPGRLSYGGDIKVDGVDDMAWWATERDVATYNAEVGAALMALGILVPYKDDLFALNDIVNTNDELRGQTVKLKGFGSVELGDDLQAVTFAVPAGYTFIKVPDSLRGKNSKYFEMLILDRMVSQGGKYWWEQSESTKTLRKMAAKTRRQLRAGNPAADEHRRDGGDQLATATQLLSKAKRAKIRTPRNRNDACYLAHDALFHAILAASEAHWGSDEALKLRAEELQGSAQAYLNGMGCHYPTTVHRQGPPVAGRGW
jgi:hypothetical protein